MTTIKKSTMTRDGNTYIVAETGGREVRWEAPGEYADEAAMISAVQGNEDMLVRDSYRREYPAAKVDPREGETLRAAWERVIAAGVDDTRDADGNAAGVALDKCRAVF